jgi:hypothetical protein
LTHRVQSLYNVDGIFSQIFQDRDITIEDLMREKGQLVKKGSLSEDLELEFWEDTERGRLEASDKKVAP